MTFRQIAIWLLLSVLGLCDSLHAVNTAAICAAHPDAYATLAKFSDSSGSVVPERKAFHDSLIRETLSNASRISDRPKLILMAGPCGAGKSTTLKCLEDAGLLRTSDFATLSPDSIKQRIPEHGEFLKRGLSRADASELVHEESTMISREALKKALQAKKNVIVDSTLKNSEFYIGLLKNLRQSNANYSTVIVHIDADLATLQARVKRRYKETGQYVSEEAVLKSKLLVDASVKKLSPFVDTVIKIDNDRSRIVEYIRNGNSFHLVGAPLNQLRGHDRSFVRSALAIDAKARPGELESARFTSPS